MFNSDLSDKEEFKAVSVEDLEMPNGCTHGLVGNEGGDDRNGDNLFLKKHWMMRQSSHGSQNKTCKLV